MGKDISMDESRKIMSVATDVRPDENVHHDPSLSPARPARGKPVSAAESARIMSLASDIRPLENYHADDEDNAGEDGG